MFQPQALALSALLCTGLYLWWQQQKKSSTGQESGNGSILTKYTRDLTQASTLLDPVIDREEEIERIIHILSRRTKNNPLLLGEPGVGKTAIVEGIAQAIVQEHVPRLMQDKRVLALDLGALIGGTKYRGEFEERLKRLTEEIMAAGRKVILFIDEFHMVEQAKGAEGAINVSDILKPAMARGDLQLIGATTWTEYEQFIKPDHALNRRLQPVIIGEPTPEAAEHILTGIKSVYEEHHGIRYSPEAIKAAVHLSKEYIKERFLPDKAIDLIDEAGAKVAIEANQQTHHALGILHAAGGDKTKRLEELQREDARLQEELEHVKQLEALFREEGEVREIRKRMERLLQEREALQHNWERERAKPEVTADDIRSVVAEWMNIPLEQLSSS